MLSIIVSVLMTRQARPVRRQRLDGLSDLIFRKPSHLRHRSREFLQI
jgi:hypothetical protein